MTKKNQEKESYGKITVGFGTSEQRDIEIVDFVQAKYKDNRLITISKVDTEEETFYLSVENPENSGRGINAAMWLSKESFIGLLSTSILYFNAKGEDLAEILKTAVTGNEIDYSFSDNLNNPNQSE